MSEIVWLGLPLLDWLTSGGVEVKATVTGIDAKSVGTTNLYTVPTGKTLLVTHVIVRCSAATSITDAATAGVGVAGGEDDIFSSRKMTNLHTTGGVWVFSAVDRIVPVAAASTVKFGIDTGATGTSQTLVVDLVGYEV